VTSPQADSPDSPAPGGTLDRALALVEFLRARCPWDAAQTPLSLRPSLVEEAHEAAAAIAAGDAAALCEELGDLLLNVAFQVVLAEEAGTFGRADVAEALEQKMRRRHPHLYGDGPAEAWERIKARERAAKGRDAGVLDGMGGGMDPLLRSFRVQERVAGVGFDWTDARGAWEKVREEVEEVGHELGTDRRDLLEEELGDMLFAMVNLVRLAGAHPVAVLSRANAKFERRFAALEALAVERGVVLGEATLAELDVLWDAVKAAERAAKGTPAGDGE
jgi:nucleoside triphosphate diphosphatase